MKAVIVDLQGKYAAALDETGSVVRIPDAAYRIGQEIELHTVPSARPNMRRKIAATAAAAVLVLGLGTGTAYALPCGTVSLDAASSIEYTVNCFNYVLDVKGADEEAETVLSEIGKTNLRHRPITQAIETTVEQIREDGWLDEEGSTLQIRTEGRTIRHSEQLQKQLDAELAGDIRVQEQDGKPEDRRRPEPEDAPVFTPKNGDPGSLNPDAYRIPQALPGNEQTPDIAEAQTAVPPEEPGAGTTPPIPDTAPGASFPDHPQPPEAPAVPIEGMNPPEGMNPSEGMNQPEGMNPPEGVAPPQGARDNPPSSMEPGGPAGEFPH